MSERAGSRRAPAVVAAAVLVLLALIAPTVLGEFWLQVGAQTFATAIAAIGLMLLFGWAGQLSLGQPLFLVVGAYGYVLMASPPATDLWGRGWPPWLAAILAVVAAGLLGGLLSPITARLRGLQLGLATLALVLVGQWLLLTLEQASGGHNGRAVPPLEIGRISSIGSDLVVAGVHLTRAPALWYLALIPLLLVIAFTASLRGSRAGRAFTAIRDAPLQASALGIEVGRLRTAAFVLAAVYAGVAGVLMAVITPYLVPDQWGLLLSLSLLAMVVIGGLRSIGGTIVGAAFVTMMPPVLQRYADQLPGIATTGSSGGLDAGVAAPLLYGLFMVVLLLIEPGGLAALARRLIRRRPQGQADRPDPPRQPRPKDSPGSSGSPASSDDADGSVAVNAENLLPARADADAPDPRP